MEAAAGVAAAWLSIAPMIAGTSGVVCCGEFMRVPPALALCAEGVLLVAISAAAVHVDEQQYTPPRQLSCGRLWP